MCGGGGGGSGDALNYQKEQDRLREERIREGMSNIDAFFEGGVVNGERYDGFDDSFYNKRAQAYEDYANPQVKRQFRDAQEGLLYGLADSNLLNSSAAVRDFGTLDRELEDSLANVARRGGNLADQSREAVANQRSQLTALVQSTADPTAIRDQLPNVAGVLDAADSYSPLANVFEGSTRAIQAYNTGQRRDAIRNDVNQAFSSNPSSGSGQNFG